LPVVGTAGHVDHGKSTLIEALSGRDPDRWAEEKQRGLTIDLGFAWTTLDDDVEVSFVDVPGHERYLKNMLAGIEAIDVALFVVAADEGWMPQSEEHLAVLDLLSIDRAVVALTKVDTVDDDMVELATLEIEDRLIGTSLEGSQIIPVAAPAGTGLNQLRAALSSLIDSSESDLGRPRLWIDRSFSISGAGTVVTGTLLDGSIGVGDRLEVLPEGLTVRVRGLQSHEKAHERVGPTRRLAVNLSGIEVSQAPRGSMLGAPGQWRLTQRFSARFRSARYVDELPDRGAYQIHIGSGAHRGEVLRVEDDVAVIHLATPLPLRVGDRFIIRDTGRRLVVAGGRVLDPSPGPLMQAIRHGAEIDPSLDGDQVADTLIGLRGVDTLETLSAQTGGGQPGNVIVIGSTAMTNNVFDDLVARSIETVREEHRTHPLRPGLPIATLAETLAVEADVVEVVIERAPGLEKRGPHVAFVEHTPEVGAEEEAAWIKARESLGAGLAVPRASDLGLTQELLHLLVRTQRLVQVAPDLVLLPDQVETMVETMRALPDGFTVAEFRDATGLSRKYAVPFLEWADKEGLTVRRGDIRHIK
jgi:selenocysteine-specific elongation factor